MKTALSVLLLTLGLLPAPLPVAAEEDLSLPPVGFDEDPGFEDFGVLTGSGRYADCLRLVARDANRAFDEASAWRGQGGGVPARHCAALALVELGHFGEAARRLDELAEASGAGSASLRAEILSHAGNAWLLEGEAGRAVNSFSTGLALAPEGSALAAGLQLDRGRAFSLAGEWARAIDDFTMVLGKRPRAVDVLSLRAAAYRAQGRLDAARRDAEAALALNRDDPHARFERGVTRYLSGDVDGARADLAAVLRQSPEGPLAEAVRAVLSEIEIGGGLR